RPRSAHGIRKNLSERRALCPPWGGTAGFTPAREKTAGIKRQVCPRILHLRCRKKQVSHCFCKIDLWRLFFSRPWFASGCRLRPFRQAAPLAAWGRRLACRCYHSASTPWTCAPEWVRTEPPGTRKEPVHDPARGRQF